MDISFTCDKCGKRLVIDDAAAGITIECPECGKAVYVPSSASSPKPNDPPTRVEPKPLNRASTAPPRSVIPSLSRDLPTFAPNQKSAEHPSIAAGVHCLVILVVLVFLGFLVLRQNILLAESVLIPCEIFGAAAFLCAVYGMCVGYVKHGLLILGCLALITGLSYWIMVSIMVGPIGTATQRQMQEMLQQQMQNFQKAFPLPAPHP
jgi:DNA-directed RNA polymerase subunit RPC12/RpoP